MHEVRRRALSVVLDLTGDDRAPSSMALAIDGYPYPQSDEVKILGITLDTHLSFDMHFYVRKYDSVYLLA